MELRNKHKATVTNRLEDMGEEAGRSKVQCLGGNAGDVVERGPACTMMQLWGRLRR